MKQESRENINHRARIFKDKAIIPMIEDELKILVQVILGDKRTLEIEYYKDINYHDGKERLFDQYPSCKNWKKEYCKSKPTKYRGRIKELGYVFFGDSHIEIYCDIIKLFIGRKVIIPLSY